jgi:hypothetical protein
VTPKSETELVATLWRQEAPENPLAVKNRQMKELLAEKTLEADFFRGALQKVEARRQGNKPAGETASTTQSGS